MFLEPTGNELNDTPGQGANSFESRRSFPREPANDLSEIIGENGNPYCGCLVHNISKKGAMLEVSATDIPQRFILSNHKRKTKVACKVVWHCANLVGVQFLTTPRPA